MTEDALPEIWTSYGPVNRQTLAAAMNAVLNEERTTRAKERRIRLASLVALLVLCPVLVWAAAYGVSSLVRGAYALMAAGTATVIFAEWIYLSWDRRGQPRPIDARSHVQTTAFVLAHQASLLKTAPLWSAPIFLGAVLIGAWLHKSVGAAAAYVLWATTGAAWIMTAIAGMRKSARLNERRTRMVQLLADLE